MAQQFLDHSNIAAAFKQMSRKGKKGGNSNAERAWSCVEALTFSLAAEWVRKALLSGSAISAGCLTS